LYELYDGFYAILTKFRDVWRLSMMNISIDGDHPTKDPKEDEKVKEAHEATKDAKRIQTMIRNFLFQAQNFMPRSSENCSIFVHRLTQAPLGMMDGNLPYPQV